MIHRHDLWNKRMNLLNGETIPYRQLTIACCARCNNEILGDLEREVGKAFREGAQAVRDLPEDRLFLWLAKFYYGLLFREMSLLADRSEPTSDTIVGEDLLRQFAIHHLLLRRLLGSVEWNESPGSIFVFDALDNPDPAHTFDYFDTVEAPFVCLRSGSVFVVGFLQDFGAVKSLDLESAPPVAAARSVQLHPMQCGELMAFFYYVLRGRKRPPKCVVIGNGDHRFELIAVPQGGAPLFDDWNANTYRELFVGFMRQKYGAEVSSGPGVPSFILGSGGNPIQAPGSDWNPAIWDEPNVAPSE